MYVHDGDDDGDDVMDEGMMMEDTLSTIQLDLTNHFLGALQGCYLYSTHSQKWTVKNVNDS